MEDIHFDLEVFWNITLLSISIEGNLRNVYLTIRKLKRKYTHHNSFSLFQSSFYLLIFSFESDNTCSMLLYFYLMKETSTRDIITM